MFVALVPPAAAVEHLEEFLLPRQEAGPGLRWTSAEQWHLTLAFLGNMAERHLDDLEARLERAARRRTPFELALSGAGCFPSPHRAKVLFAGLWLPGDREREELRRLATGVRAASAKAGAEPGGGRFHPHLTLARCGRPIEASRWLRVLEPYRGPVWRAEEISLVESHLGEGPRGRPRYEVRGVFPIGAETAR